jgi:hypothetical protein
MYTASAFVLPGANGNADRARLAITDPAGQLLAVRQADDAPVSVTEWPWRRIIYNFAVPDGVSQVKLVLRDDALPAGTTLYWDFVELERAFATDTAAPVVASGAFEFDVRHAIALSFSENVAPTLANTDLRVTNLADNQDIPAGAIAVVYPGGLAPAVISFPGMAGGVLPDGDYRFTLPSASVADLSGNALVSDYTFDFWFVNADANRDRRVDLDDFNILATHFGQSGATFTDGDFNADQRVDLDDFNILASRFGGGLVALASSGQQRPAAQARIWFADMQRSTIAMRRLVLDEAPPSLF